MGDLSVTLSNVKLDNPIIPASGTFGYGMEFKDFYDINILGSFSMKGTTKEEKSNSKNSRVYSRINKFGRIAKSWNRFCSRKAISFDEKIF